MKIVKINEPDPVCIGGSLLEIELCRTELEMLLKRMNEFPSAPNWISGRDNNHRSIWYVVSAVDNFGVE